MADRRKSAALTRALAAMFRALEQRPIPPDIRATIDQLEEPRQPLPKPVEADAP